MQRIGTIAELWRYPVKSMRGERLDQAVLEPAGVAGDRRFALASTAAPLGKPLLSSRERSAMLLYAPRLEPQPEVTTPTGATLPLPSAELLAALQTALAGHGGSLSLLASPEQPLTDVRPVSLVSRATLQGLSREHGRPVAAQRFRSNLILALEDDEPFAEDALAGSTLRFGNEDGPELRLLERIPRCRIVSLDPETAATDPDLLRLLAQKRAGRVGVYASVLRPGRLRVGDPIFSSARLCGPPHKP